MCLVIPHSCLRAILSASIVVTVCRVFLLSPSSFDQAASRDSLVFISDQYQISNLECQHYEPLALTPERLPTTTNINSTGQVIFLRQPTPTLCGQLRRDWDGVAKQPFYNPLADKIHQHQSNCSLPVSTFHVDNSFGLGSHLYLWSQAFCNAEEAGYRLQTYNPGWLWLDRTSCDPDIAAIDPLSCYFQKVENLCPVQDTGKNRFFLVNVTNPRDPRSRCSRIQDNKADFFQNFRSASMEYFFHSISPLVIREAKRQLGLLFAEIPIEQHTRIKEELISVHMRWGDKFWEMDLAPVGEYIDAIHTILQERETQIKKKSRLKYPGTEISDAHIYLACEDPKAVQAFLDAVPKNWHVYVDRTISELGAFRPPKGNRASWTAKNTKGRAGLVALGSLLVALEADAFVLTTASNWSRLINELRKTIIDPRCRNCTKMIDLRPGVW